MNDSPHHTAALVALLSSCGTTTSVCSWTSDKDHHTTIFCLPFLILLISLVMLIIAALLTCYLQLGTLTTTKSGMQFPKVRHTHTVTPTNERTCQTKAPNERRVRLLLVHHCSRGRICKRFLINVGQTEAPAASFPGCPRLPRGKTTYLSHITLKQHSVCLWLSLKYPLQTYRLAPVPSNTGGMVRATHAPHLFP